jgi:hypothetical protein
MGKVTEFQIAQPYTGTTADVMDALFPVRTTAQLAAIGDEINTLDKRVGKMVFDSTKGQPVWADAATAGGTWSLSTGVVASTPV